MVSDRKLVATRRASLSIRECRCYPLSSTASISCSDERDKAAKVYKDNPDAWIDLLSTDKIEIQCQINEYIEKLKHPK